MESTFSLLIQPIGYTNQSGGRGPVDRFKLCRETENILKISKNISDGSCKCRIITAAAPPVMFLSITRFLCCNKKHELLTAC